MPLEGGGATIKRAADTEAGTNQGYRRGRRLARSYIREDVDMYVYICLFIMLLRSIVRFDGNMFIYTQLYIDSVKDIQNHNSIHKNTPTNLTACSTL